MKNRHAATPSLRARALLAVALTVAFYALAVGIALALIAAPIILFASSGRGNIWIALAMIGAGVAILRAIIPERARIEQPGPQLRRGEQPRLHQLLDDVAARVGHEPADAVYLDLPVNASVIEDRGRRVMHLGLPLLAAIEPDELRAVVAHEYGHYVAGDTRFSNWIWRTRVAVMKTVQHLRELLVRTISILDEALTSSWSLRAYWVGDPLRHEYEVTADELSELVRSSALERETRYLVMPR